MCRKVIVNVIHGHDKISQASVSIKQLAQKVLGIEETEDGGKVALAALLEAAAIRKIHEHEEIFASAIDLTEQVSYSVVFSCHMNACTHAYIHLYIHTIDVTHKQNCIHIYIHTTYTCIHIHTCIHT
jgi:hypothetical protein